jgi:hypothetical protein
VVSCLFSGPFFNGLFGRGFGDAPYGQHGNMWGFSESIVAPDIESLGNWGGYTIPLIRTVAYSLGALAGDVATKRLGSGSV